MNHILSKILLLAALAIPASAWSTSPIVVPRSESKIVAQARELIDTYYGNQGNLRRASQLLELALKENPDDANVFVQAARITVMGGYLSFDQYRVGTFERYGALLDKAISIDPSNAKAHILKAQFFEHEGKLVEQLAELDKAKALGTTDPWLLIGYGEYYKKIKSTGQAYQVLTRVAAPRVGSSASERKAYVGALHGLRTMLVEGERIEDKLRTNAAMALKARYPTDAWTPHGYAEDFIDRQLFDDAIFYAREALKTMNFGAGKLTLAASLYAKAAQLIMAGRPLKEAQPFIGEAKALGFSKPTILEYLVHRRGFDGSLGIFTPTLDTIIR